MMIFRKNEIIKIFMGTIRNTIKRLLGENNLERIRSFRLNILLKKSFSKDYDLYKKHSSVFKKDTYKKIESEITLRYHSIEKGFLHQPIRFRFAKKRVEELINYLRQNEILNHIKDVQIQSAILNLCSYYEFHFEHQININDYFSEEDYNYFKKMQTLNLHPVKHHTSMDYFKYKKSDFKEFSTSRCSVRDYSGEKIPIETIQKVIDLANNAPSVCNRQGVSVNLVDNKQKIDNILEIQGGLKGYSSNLTQLIVLTSNRNYFYSIGERYQLYIDGGIYLMNLLYALHYYEIVACPAHRGMPIEADYKVQKIIGLDESEKIICLIAIGLPVSDFRTTLSLRRNHTENLNLIK